MKKLFSLMLAVLMMMSVCTAFAEAPAKTTIEIVMPKPEIREHVAATTERYNTEVLAGTPYTVQFEVFADGYADYLMTRFAANNMVDVFFREPYTQLLQWLDYAEPLTDQPWVEDLDDAAKDGYIWGGDLYAMPLGYEAVGVWYHKDILEQCGRTEFPTTWDELLAFTDELVAAGIQPTRQVFNNLNVNDLMQVLYYSDDAFDVTFEKIAKDEIRLADQDGWKYFTRWLDYAVKYGAKDAEDAVGIDNEKKTKFCTKQVAFMPEGVWQENSFAAAVDVNTLGFTVFPFADTVEENRLPTAVPMGFIVYNGSPVKEEAKKFMTWFHDQGTSELVDKWQITPCWKSMAADTEGKLGVANSATLKFVQEGKTVPWSKFYFPVASEEDALGAIQAYILGELSAEEAADMIQESWMANFEPFPSKT